MATIKSTHVLEGCSSRLSLSAASCFFENHSLRESFPNMGRPVFLAESRTAGKELRNAFIS